MTPEEKELLLKDLCGRLPYKVNVNVNEVVKTLTDIYSDKGLGFDNNSAFYGWGNNTMIPYLRPMSSMSRDESFELGEIMRDLGSSSVITNVVDFYNAHHLDHHNLIEKGLALEAPEGMYKL